MELAILVEIDFDMQLTSSYRFLERFAKLAKVDDVLFNLGRYMLELGLLDSKMHQFKPSLQAVSALYLAAKFLKLYNDGDSHGSLSCHALLSELNLTKVYLPDDVRNCASCFEQLASLIQTSNLQVIVQKFKSSKYFEVSRIVAKIMRQKKKMAAHAQQRQRSLEQSTSTQKGQATLSTQKSTAGQAGHSATGTSTKNHSQTRYGKPHVTEFHAVAERHDD